MTRLLLETATEVCSVAVSAGTEILADFTATDPFRHSSHLTTYMQRVLREAGVEMAQLQEIVLSDGPGSYTSLRVGAATAKGLCLALPGLALRSVPTLAALAYAANYEGFVLATINSRRGEVFGQLFDTRALPRVRSNGGDTGRAPIWGSPQNIKLTEAGWWVALVRAAGTLDVVITGPGQQRLLDALVNVGEARGLPPGSCRATHLLAPAAAPTLSRLVDVASYEPLYVNPPFVTKSKKKPLG